VRGHCTRHILFNNIKENNFKLNTYLKLFF